MREFAILGLAILTAVISQLLFKKGVTLFGDIEFSIRNVGVILLNIFRNPFILTGLLFYGISFLFWLFVLTKMKLSIAYPITSLNFVLVLIASYYLFGEKLSFLQYGGILLIMLGIYVLSRT